MFSSHPERDAREVRVIDQQRVYLPQDQVGFDEPIGYQRTTRRVITKNRIDLKFLIPALVLGLALASGALSSDHMGSSIGDRISYGVHNLGDHFHGGYSWLSSFFIPRQAPLSERLMDKARYGADKLVDTASDAQEAVRDATGRLWDSKDDMLDRARDLYDDYEYDMVRRPMRRLRRAAPSTRHWSLKSLFSVFSIFSMIPWVPLILGAIAFFGLRPLINEWRSRNMHDNDVHLRSSDMYRPTTTYTTTQHKLSLKDRMLSSLALLLNKIGDFLFRTGRDIREADSFRSLKPATAHLRHDSMDFSRPAVSSSASHVSSSYVPASTTTFAEHELPRTSQIARPIHRATESADLSRSGVSYAPIISSHTTSVPLSSTVHETLPSSTESTTIVPINTKLTSPVTAEVLEPRVTSNGVAWTVPPAVIEPLMTTHSVVVKPVDPVLLDKIVPEMNKKEIDHFPKSEGEPRMLFGGH